MLATMITLATICLVLPFIHHLGAGPGVHSAQLAFAAIASLVSSAFRLHPDGPPPRLLPASTPALTAVTSAGPTIDLDDDGHADPPTTGAARARLLVVSLVAVVGLAKIESPGLEEVCRRASGPWSAS